jgi:periplasmic protein TonB
MSYVTQNRRQNPGSMLAAIAINGSIILAVALSPMVINPPEAPTRTTTFPVPREDPVPPKDPIKKEEVDTNPRTLPPIHVPETPIDMRNDREQATTTNDPVENTGGAVDGSGKGDEAVTTPRVDPDPVLPPPVFRKATRDMRFADDFQPQYPPGLIQREIEGSATIRVLIGPDGRVREASVVSATHPDFGKAAVKQALKAWRFKPATRGDEKVEDWQTISVSFVIT